MEFKPPYTSPFTTKNRRATKLLLTVVYSPMLDLILSQIAYVVHMHMKFEKTERQSYANDCSS